MSRQPMRTKLSAPDASSDGQGGCVHHWLVETPQGRTFCAATCKRCGAERQFRTAEPEDIRMGVEPVKRIDHKGRYTKGQSAGPSQRAWKGDRW